jgi:hypothetical protein
MQETRKIFPKFFSGGNTVINTLAFRLKQMQQRLVHNPKK